MQLRVNKQNTFDNALLLLMYLQLVILEFFGFSNILNKIVCILVILRVVVFPGRQLTRVLIEGCFLAAIYLVGAVSGEVLHWGYVYSNSLMIIYPLIYAYYIAFLAKNRPDYLDERLSKCFGLFNITLVINMIVIFIQIIYPYSIQAVTDNVINYYQDTVSGLFAYASTHNICLFTIAVTLYNLSYKERFSRRTSKIWMMIYTLIMVVISFALALFNDNKALFVLLPLVLFIYWFTDAKRARSSNRLLLICILPIIFIAGYVVIPDFRSFIDKNVLRIFEMAASAVTLGNQALGSNERIAIILYALQHGTTWLFGKGFGATTIYSEGFEGFKHFGQADLGSFLVLGGIWFFVILIVIYCEMFLRIIGRLKKEKRFTIAILLILLLVSTYTQCFSRPNTMICLILIMLSFRVRFHKSDPAPDKKVMVSMQNKGIETG